MILCKYDKRRKNRKWVHANQKEINGRRYENFEYKEFPNGLAVPICAIIEHKVVWITENNITYEGNSWMSYINPDRVEPSSQYVEIRKRKREE